MTLQYMDMWPGCAREGGGCFPQYIPRLCVTEEYITLYSSVRRNRGIKFIFLDTDEYMDIFVGVVFFSYFIG
jgi:hypothetical protein